MCGISGFAARGGSLARASREPIERMNRSQACRGPDDEGSFFAEDAGLAFGHRRLSILDLSPAGHQPMERDGRWITFNGEIYNFHDLRADLAALGHRFMTETDTEVILAAYAAWGTDALSRMRGIFAFALWDGARRRLVLARDHYGVKPLYYSHSSRDGSIAFASTVRALQESGLISPEHDPDAFIEFLLCGSVPSPRTTLRSVRQLPPGHCAVWEDGALSISRYYTLTPRLGQDTFSAAAETVQRAFTDAVRLNLVSDAPLGVFLSGGLDSSAIAAVAAGARQERITTLSVVFEEQEFSERPYQRMMARAIASDHHESLLRKDDLYAALPDIFAAMDQPTVDGVNTFFVSRAARQAGLKVVLSGLGGDEIFCGYPHLRRAHLSPLFRAALRAPLPWRALSRLSRRYGRVAHLSARGPEGVYFATRGLFAPREVAGLLGVTEESVWRSVGSLRDGWRSARPAGPAPLANQLSALEIGGYLVSQLLKDTDMMSMRHSIEARVPFLDPPLVEHLLGLSPAVKIDRRVNKPLLAAAVSGLVPREIIERKKMGFTFPFALWLRDLPLHFPLSPRAEMTYRMFMKGNIHWSRLWAVVVLDNTLAIRDGRG